MIKKNKTLTTINCKFALYDFKSNSYPQPGKKKITLCNLFNIQLEKKLQNSYSHHFLSFQAPKKKKNYPLTIRPNFFHLCKFVKMFHVSHTQKKTRKGNDWLTQRSVCQSSQRNINDHIRMHTMANLNFFMQNNHNMLVIVILQYNVARFSLVFSS